MTQVAKASGRQGARRAARPSSSVFSGGIARGVAGLAATVALAWAAFDPRFRDAEAAWQGTICFPWGLALAALVFALAPRAWGSARLWLALAIVGQASTLQLIEAGPTVSYQHLRLTPEQWSTPLLVPLACVMVQVVLVAIGFARHGSTIRRTILGRFRAWQWLLIAAVFCLTSAAVSRDPARYAAEVVAVSFLQLVALGNFALAIVVLPESTATQWGDRWRRWFGPQKDTDGTSTRDIIPWIAAGWVVLVAAALAWFSYQRHPHVPDEVVYLIHARYLAAGHLTMPLPPAPEAFNLDLMFYDADRWYCPVPPGWPLALSLGALVSAEWLVNPLLAGLNVLLAYRLAASLYDRGTARVVAMLLAVSPWHMLMSMNFMTHQWTLTCALAAAVLLGRIARGGTALLALPAGGALGMLSMIRPLEALCASAVLGLWSLVMSRSHYGESKNLPLPPGEGRGEGAMLSPPFQGGVGGGIASSSLARRVRTNAAVAALLVLGALAVGSVQLAYNAHLTGHPRKFPIMAYVDKYYGPGRNDMGFGPNRGLGWTGLDPRPGHDLFDAAINANLNCFAVNVELFGWACGSLAPVLLVFLLPGRRAADVWLAGSVLLIIAAHMFYWFSGGPDFGARYWFLILVPCVMLTARGCRSLAASWSNDTSAGRLGWALAALAVMSVGNFLPWRAIDKYYHYRGMRPEVREFLSQPEMRGALVLVRGDRHPDFASAAIYNPLELRDAAGPIFAWDHSPEARRQALEAFPDRPVWLVDGPTRTGRGFEIAAGPLRNPEEFRENADSD